MEGGIKRGPPWLHQRHFHQCKETKFLSFQQMQQLIWLRITSLIDDSFTGLQAAESIHHSSESHAINCQRFLENGLWQKMWSDSDALWPGGEWEGERRLTLCSDLILSTVPTGDMLPVLAIQWISNIWRVHCWTVAGREALWVQS